MKNIFKVVLLLLLPVMATAQETDSIGVLKKPVVQSFHFGLIYPISTNGVRAFDYVNKVSLHLWAGAEAGLDGFGLSGLANVDRDYVKGVQLAGITNVNAGYLTGIQMAGIANVNAGNIEGAVFAGIANVTGGDARAGQFAGIVNVTAGAQDGGAFAGIANVSADSTRGGQFAGIVNVSPRFHTGAQIAGIVNVSGDITGSQISGVFNVASKVKGAQIGLFNFADSVDGVSIGLLSIVRHGYHRFEVSGSEALHVQAALKLGVRSFYNIFAIGYHFSSADPFDNNNSPTWAYGYGVGSEWSIGKNWIMNADLTVFDVIEKENTWRHKKLNLLNQFRLNFGVQMGRHTALVFGPTFNVMVSEITGDDGFIGSDLPSYTVYNRTHNGTNVKMWPGVNVAIRF